MDTFSEILRSVWGVALAIFFFGGTIFIHELGHFIAAKKRGLKVERFSIGFGPRIWGWTGKDGVDYRISLFPLGGYVALPQMADMSAVEGDTDDDAERLPKIGYADKMIVAVMGATFNVLFAIVLACILSLFGRPVALNSESAVIGYIQKELKSPITGETFPSPAANSRLKPGDRVLAVDGKPVKNFQDIAEAVALGNRRDEKGNPITDFTVERNGVKLEGDIRVEPVVMDQYGSGDAIRVVGMSAEFPVHVEVENPNSPAAKGGMKSGDRIVSVNDVRVLAFEHFRDLLAEQGDSPVKIHVARTESGKTTEKELIIVPEIVPYTYPLLTLKYPDNGLERRVVLVPAPAKIESAKDFEAPRTQLMVREDAPADSTLAEHFKAGTRIVAVNGERMIQNVTNLDAVVATARDRAPGKPVTLSLRRGEEPMSLPILGATFEIIPAEKKAAIGIETQIRPNKVRQAPWTYLIDSFGTTFRTLKALTAIDSDVGVKHLTGVVGIARLYYGISDNILNVLWFTLIINVNLAVMNLLPLPVLDGGHMVYATLEKIRGKALHRKTIETVQTAFVILLFAMMAYVIFNDFRRIAAGREADRRAVVEALVSKRHLEFGPAETGNSK